ncbi:MAG TPA: hypothetical protein VKX49_26165 [Bryobacteraceae bacterium]|nr:hypothetical protein [Bryobacteraceae bacterium]
MNPAEVTMIEALAPVAEKLVEDLIGLIEKHKSAASTPSKEEVAATVTGALAAAPVVPADAHEAALAQVADMTARLAKSTQEVPTAAAHGVIFTGSSSTVQR